MGIASQGGDAQPTYNINLHDNLHWNYQQVSKTRRVMLIYARLVEQTTRN